MEEEKIRAKKPEAEETDAGATGGKTPEAEKNGEKEFIEKILSLEEISAEDIREKEPTIEKTGERKPEADNTGAHGQSAKGQGKKKKSAKENRILRAGKLYGTFLKMTLIPLLLSGIVIIISSSVNLRMAMQGEIEQTLRDVAVTVLAAYDALSEGDYNLLIDEKNDKTILQKGNLAVSGDYRIIDSLKQQTDIDISIFFYDIRLLTTLYDADDNRYIGNNVNQRVFADVLQQGREHFYTNVEIGKRDYYAYYIPVFGQDGTCIGMIGTAKPATSVQRTLDAFLRKNVLLIVAAMILTAVFIAYFSNQIVGVIHRIMEFLEEMAKGNLDGEIDVQVVKRNDELGEMGRFTQKVQYALRKLIERDPLTNLYNRRSGEKKMTETIRYTKKSGGSFALVFGDIDFFKKINDTYGHDFGDVVLIETAKILSDNMAGKGYVIRWGGEEFLIVLQNFTKEKAIAEMTGILEQIRGHVMSSGEISTSITMTFGVTEGSGEESLDDLIKAADAKLYFGKKNGRNRICS